MTSNAVHLIDLDTAMKQHYSGITISVDGVPTPVQVFLEQPSTEGTPNRVYPSVSILYAGDVPDFESMHSDDDSVEEIGINSAVSPAERIERIMPEPARVRYIVGTWHKDRAAEDRRLVREVYRKRTPSRGYLTVQNVDGEAIKVWLFRMAPSLVEVEDRPDADTIIYHKTLMVEVLVHLSEVEYDETTSTKVAEEVQWDVQSRKVLWNSHGQVGGFVEGGDKTDRVIRVTEDTEEVLP